MKKKALEQMLPLNLQFFASKEDEEDVNAGGAGAEGEDDEEDSDGEEDVPGKKTESEKTFTQKEVTAMMTREKREGRKALLKSLGFKTEADAKNAVALYNALVDSQKSEEEKQKDRATHAESDKDEAEARAKAAEDKLACVLAGVSKGAIEDVLAIAYLKVTEEKDLDKVLAEMKKEARYASFFQEGDEEEDPGTGSEPGHTKKKSKSETKGSYGAKLAKSQHVAPQKSTYF